MSITEELRKIAAKTERASGRCEKLYRGDLDHAADRIDERIEREYVKLPVDADGVPIHVGDELVDEKDRPVKVRVLKLRENGWLFDSSYCWGGMSTTPFRHVQPDSWERIIEDAANLVRGDNESVVELVERCRRLAGEA